MEIPLILIKLLLWLGLFLFLAGTFFYFIPNILVKWNAIGNTWIGFNRSAAQSRRNYFADYAIFLHHKTTGRILWGFAFVFTLVYLLYT